MKVVLVMASRNNLKYLLLVQHARDAYDLGSGVMKCRQPLIEQLILTPMDHGSYTFTCINTISVTFWVKIGHELYPFHLVSDFGTEFILKPGFFIIAIISFTKAIFGSKLNSVPKSLTR